MKQIRLQPLNETHQQLGTLLCKTALSLHTTDYTIPQEWSRLIQQIKNTSFAFNNFAEKEENILFPLLHNYEPALVAILRDDLCGWSRYLNDVYELLAAKEYATDKHKSRLFSHTLLYRFNEFVAATLQQMNEQEQMVNGVLWKYYNDKELVQLTVALAVTPAATTQKKDTTFADTVINHILPSTDRQPAYKRRVADQAFKQHGAAKLALAI